MSFYDMFVCFLAFPGHIFGLLAKNIRKLNITTNLLDQSKYYKNVVE